MLPSEKIELAIYKRIKPLGPVAAETFLATLQDATGADHLTTKNPGTVTGR
jgi:hypothetical protein